MKRIIFDSAPEFIMLCVVVALLYAGIQYYRTRQQPWGSTLNWVLFSMRALLTFFVAFLLLGPIVKQINNLFEKPFFVLLYDNSASIAQTTDSTNLNTLQNKLRETREALEESGYTTATHDLNGENTGSVKFNLPSSDIHSSLRRISNLYEGQKVGGVILVSDGIYNAGLSPAHASYNYPIHTVGVGDTTQRTDILIRNLAYNKIAYQGNKFPLRADVQIKNLEPQDVTVSLMKRGTVIEKQTKKSKADDLLTFDFQPLAEEQGIQKLDIVVETKPGEQNTKNNRASVFVEVVEGKKKILVVAPSPHPDIKALRDVIEKNSNYEFLLHMPGISEQQASVLRPDKIDLVIFHQSPDTRGKTTQIFQSFLNTRTSLLMILGQQSDIIQLTRANMPIKFEGVPREFDEVTPVSNPNFSSFSVSTEANTVLADVPPVFVHFGRTQVAQTATPLLFQKVGNVTTDKPLLAVEVKDSRKIGMMLGEGLWRWKLNEFERTENSQAFDEVFGKLIQFLSTTEDKRKFRSYPVKQEFSDTEAVVFESQVYNDIFEPVYGNSIQIDVTNESGSKTQYSYVTSPGNARYQIGGLKPGVYKYRSRTSINGSNEEVRGEFAVTEQQAELQNLTADFDLLKTISKNTAGKFYRSSEVDRLKEDLQSVKAKSTIHTEETYDSLVNLKWVFWLLVLLVGAEWFLRKFHGSY
jgi:hypothetical protein